MATFDPDPIFHNDIVINHNNYTYNHNQSLIFNAILFTVTEFRNRWTEEYEYSNNLPIELNLLCELYTRIKNFFVI